MTESSGILNRPQGHLLLICLRFIATDPAGARQAIEGSREALRKELTSDLDDQDASTPKQSPSPYLEGRPYSPISSVPLEPRSICLRSVEVTSICVGVPLSGRRRPGREGSCSHWSHESLKVHWESQR